MKEWAYHGRWALVTGASAGIGEVFAHQLAERGMNLVLTARREDRLDALQARLMERFSVDVRTVPTDLADRDGPTRLWNAASSIALIDLLVNNAGFGAQGAFDEVSLERHTDLLTVNCRAPMELAHFALPAMRARGGGGIINVSSIAAFQPVPRLATYAASKAFLQSFSEALWVENEPHGIRVLALCPGRTPTEFQEIAGTGEVAGSFGFRTPEQVVVAGLSAFEAGRSYLIPGWENALAMSAVRVLPRGAVIRGMKRIMKRVWKQ